LPKARPAFDIVFTDNLKYCALPSLFHPITLLSFYILFSICHQFKKFDASSRIKIILTESDKKTAWFSDLLICTVSPLFISHFSLPSENKHHPALRERFYYDLIVGCGNQRL
jgi:hypothetical protein